MKVFEDCKGEKGKPMKFKPGDVLPTTVMEAVTGEAIDLPDPKCLVHLQFRRFLDCPIRKRLFVTGKLWPSVFEISLSPKRER